MPLISQAKAPEIVQLIESATGHSFKDSDRLFLLLDGARLPEMPAWLDRNIRPENWISLFGATAGSPLLSASPVLVCLTAEILNTSFVRRLFKNTEYFRAASLLTSALPMASLAEHLTRHLYITDPDDTRWALAFWDPFILAALVGARPAQSTLVPGPVLTTDQSSSLLAPIATWCFIGLDGSPRALLNTASSPSSKIEPFALNQQQMDQLADLPLPDLVIKTLNEVSPELGSAYDREMLHSISCAAITESRRHGKDDLASYCEIAYERLTLLNEQSTENLTQVAESSGSK